MGRAQAAHGRSLGRSCCLNRFATRDVFDGAGSLRGPCAGPAGTGGILPPSTNPFPSRSGEDSHQSSEEEVVLWDLWQHLPRAEQIRFGACFSRMVLKILSRSDGLDLEERA